MNIESKVQCFLEETLLFSFENDGIGKDDNLFDKGLMDSFALVQLAVFLEKEFSIDLGEHATSPQLGSLSGTAALVEELLRVGT